MKRVLALVFVLGIVAGTGVANAQLIIGGGLNNGDLDLTDPTEIVPGFFLPKPAVWQNVGTRTLTGPYEDEMSSEPWAGPTPTPVTTNATGAPGPDGCGLDQLDCGVFFKPFSGGGTNGPATGHLFQDNPATPGLTYVLTGWAGAEPNFLGGAEFAVEFLDGASSIIGGAELDLIAAGLFTDNGLAFDYKKYTVSAVAPAGTVSVRARASMTDAMSNPAGGGQAYVVDDFTLTAVPEPATFALFGLAVTGLMGIRRRSK
jgi:hypothetical protein